MMWGLFELYCCFFAFEVSVSGDLCVCAYTEYGWMDMIMIMIMLMHKHTTSYATRSTRRPDGGKPDQTRPGLAAPRPPTQLPFFTSRVHRKYIYKATVVSALSSKDIPWLMQVKIKRPSLLATISSKGYLKLAFRQALIAPLHLLHNSHLAFSRYSVSLETLI